MMDIFLVIDELLVVISIFALAFFCAVLPNTNIAKYFYILFGVTLIPVGIKFVLDGKPWYEFIWVFLFAAVGIFVGIMLFWINQNTTEEEQREFDRAFGNMARRGGKRRMFGAGLFKKKTIVNTYDKDNKRPVIKASICNGEQIAGFKDIHTGKMEEVMLIKNPSDIDAFKKMYGIDEEIEKEY